ncbi:nudix hydrolase 18, mitochondrial-like [Impatiens glandulifera]|uniref:nudix hydrolase 18, mitochondrial-like n=1 Tax=Impatiens glandulifera TaxID=253017 RepID=UPI001FB15ADA|nr:nudix hydrolase 18, mitochondrial-like [Impatiens glandulifera]
MVALVSRTGRHLQRYSDGRRLIVGCIPYRYKAGKRKGCLKEDREVEVLVISSQRQGKGMLFPKGGWERDESMKDAAQRETMEEAGVMGIVQRRLGKWRFKSKSNETDHEGHMFPLLVEQQLDLWPEKEFRQRIWMSVSEAKEACQQVWMLEALEEFENRLNSSSARPKMMVKEDIVEQVVQCSMS